jgi:hypothetical protein
MESKYAKVFAKLKIPDPDFSPRQASSKQVRFPGSPSLENLVKSGDKVGVTATQNIFDINRCDFQDPNGSSDSYKTPRFSPYHLPRFNFQKYSERTDSNLTFNDPENPNENLSRKNELLSAKKSMFYFNESIGNDCVGEMDINYNNQKKRNFSFYQNNSHSPRDDSDHSELSSVDLSSKSKISDHLIDLSDPKEPDLKIKSIKRLKHKTLRIENVADFLNTRSPLAPDISLNNLQSHRFEEELIHPCSPSRNSHKLIPDSILLTTKQDKILDEYFDSNRQGPENTFQGKSDGGIYRLNYDDDYRDDRNTALFNYKDMTPKTPIKDLPWNKKTLFPFDNSFFKTITPIHKDIYDVDSPNSNQFYNKEMLNFHLSPCNIDKCDHSQNFVDNKKSMPIQIDFQLLINQNSAELNDNISISKSLHNMIEAKVQISRNIHAPFLSNCKTSHIGSQEDEKGQSKNEASYETPEKKSSGSKFQGDISPQRKKNACINAENMNLNLPFYEIKNVSELFSNINDMNLSSSNLPLKNSDHDQDKYNNLSFSDNNVIDKRLLESSDNINEHVSLFDMKKELYKYEGEIFNITDINEETEPFYLPPYQRKSPDIGRIPKIEEKVDLCDMRLNSRSKQNSIYKNFPSELEVSHNKGNQISGIIEFCESSIPQINPNLKIKTKNVQKSEIHSFSIIDSPPQISTNKIQNTTSNVTEIQLKKHDNSEEKQTRIDTEFDIIKVLGTGNFGKVYQCRNKFDGVEYAIKSIEDGNPEKALKEAQILSYISSMYDSSHIVRYYSSWMEDQIVYIVTEICLESMDVLMDKKCPLKIPEKILINILSDICKALKKLHQDKIIHLDIKPENVLLSQTGKYKLCDFGLAKLLTLKNEVSDMTEGDSRYLAEELLDEVNWRKIANGELDLTKSDIFSLGLMLYGIMTKHSLDIPGSGPVWHELRKGVLSDMESLVEYTLEFRSLIRDMMHSDPSKRPTAAEILKDIKSWERKNKRKRIPTVSDQLFTSQNSNSSLD